MKRIWLVRHAESKSQTGETDDHLNPELSRRGIQQAERLGERLQSVEPDCILVSPLRRAWQTYAFSTAGAQSVEFDSRLIELDWGMSRLYEKILPVSTPDIASPDRHDAWLESDGDRTRRLLTEVLDREEDRLLLFGHWGVFHRLLFAFMGWGNPEKKARATMDNAGISLLEVDDGQDRFIRYWNDRAHVIDLL